MYQPVDSKKTTRKMNIFDSIWSFFFGTKQEAVENASLQPVKHFIKHSIDPKIFVLYGTEDSGKTYAVKKFASCMRNWKGDAEPTTAIIRDLNDKWPFWSPGKWSCYDCTDKKKSIFWWTGYEPARDMDIKISKCIRNANPWSARFYTIILDDFDQHMHKDAKTALDFICNLQQDSLTSRIFNVLVICKESLNAYKVLDSFHNGHYDIAILRWTSEEAVKVVDQLSVQHTYVSDKTKQVAVDHLVATSHIGEADWVCIIRKKLLLDTCLTGLCMKGSERMQICFCGTFSSSMQKTRSPVNFKNMSILSSFQEADPPQKHF